jgi:hypothetical protein
MRFNGEKLKAHIRGKIRKKVCIGVALARINLYDKSIKGDIIFPSLRELGRPQGGGHREVHSRRVSQLWVRW